MQLKPKIKKKATADIINRFGLSVKKACELIEITRSTYLYKLKRISEDFIIKQIENILKKNGEYGCSLVRLKLRQKKIPINHKRTERIYKEQGYTQKPKKGRKKFVSEKRIAVEKETKIGNLWAIDFVSDLVGKDRRLKILTVIDPTSNKSPIIYPDYSITGKDLTDILDFAIATNGQPKIIQCDNGPEFRSKEFDKWCYQKGIKISYSRPGKPTDNCFIESFNATFRKECLNTHYFESLEDARNKIGEWHTEYNYERPQKRLKGLTPIEYETKIKEIEFLL